DFGLSKRIGDNSITEVFGIVPYIDPVRFSDAKNKISSGKSLISKKVELQNTPEGYSNLYISNERPKIQEVVKILKAMISSSDSKYTQEIIIRVDLGGDKNDINSSEKQGSSSNEMITTELSNVIKTFHQRDLKFSSASESPPNSTPDVDKENDVTEMNETDDPIAQTDSTADLIRDMVDILNDVADIYKTALHCKNITRILMERISAAVSAVILQSSEDLLKDHIGLHKLIQTLNKMKIYIDEITQYDIVLQFLEDKSIENKFKDLCKEYDDRNDVLSFAIELKTNAEKEDKVLEGDVKELLKFQKTFEESIRI
ncbi:1900_t:CDS:2, partial [Funneliformis caledonium]